MWKNRKNLKRVETWYDTDTGTPLNALESAISTGTGSGSPTVYFFQDIWVPFAKRKGGNGSDKHDIVPGEYVYQNVGFTTDQIADIYWTQYRSLFLSEPLDTTDTTAISNSVQHLGKIIKAVLTKNKYKYLKWIDEMGYAYNPLWNVDGVEEYQSIDEHGNVTRTNTPILQSEQEFKTVPYDNSTYNPTNKTINTYSGTQSTETETHASIITDESGIPGVIHNITGGDYTHIEKRLRQGNIGVTKSTELIESERELVRFNLLQEFFNDINKEILIGVYI